RRVDPPLSTRVRKCHDVFLGQAWAGLAHPQTARRSHRGASRDSSVTQGRDDASKHVSDRVPNLRVVVGTRRDNDRQIEVGHDEQALAAVAEAGAPRQLLSLPVYGAGPPLIAVLQPVTGGNVRA